MAQMVKTITVRVVEFVSNDGNTGSRQLSQQTVQITKETGFEAAVKLAFPPFPNNCQRVVLLRGGVLLWSKGVDNKKWLRKRSHRDSAGGVGGAGGIANASMQALLLRLQSISI